MEHLYAECLRPFIFDLLVDVHVKSKNNTTASKIIEELNKTIKKNVDDQNKIDNQKLDKIHKKCQ